MSNVNTMHKDRVFCSFFGRKENKEETLSLFNAVNNTSYSDADAIEFTTIENVLYMSMKNDISFLIDDTMNLYEHQSTINPNMPMRMLIYSGMLYTKYVQENASTINLYSTRQQMFPIPKLYGFYYSEKRTIPMFFTAA